jgi:transcriptional regulator with XRE-family HTH domain
MRLAVASRSPNYAHHPRIRGYALAIVYSYPRARKARSTGMKLGRSIREARRAAGLTQEHLGRRLGLKGRAIYRWERDESAPTRRHRRALIEEIRAVNASAAAELLAALTAELSKRGKGTSPAPALPAAPPPAAAPDVHETFEVAVLRMADELDLPARRVRRPLARLFARLRAGDVSLEVAEKELAGLIAQGG